MPGMSEVSDLDPRMAVDPLAGGPGRPWSVTPGTEAFEQLSQADREASSSGTDLEALALAAFFAAHADVEVRCQGARLQGATRRRATSCAPPISRSTSPATTATRASHSHRLCLGPPRRADHRRRRRDVRPRLSRALRSEAAAWTGDLESALALAERAVEIGTRRGRRRPEGLRAQTNLGALKIASGATSDGFALMEEASIAAVNGELSPFTTGVTACRMIGACRDLTDYRRASEWIEATEKYCDRQSVSGFPGVCRIHRAEVAAVSGGWERAEQELEQATTELGAYNATPPQADGFYAIGDIRRLRGDFEGAEAALREAHARGRSPQPALALIRLAEGKIKAAAAAINAAVAEEDLGSLGPGATPAGPGRDRHRGRRV